MNVGDIAEICILKCLAKVKSHPIFVFPIVCYFWFNYKTAMQYDGKSSFQCSVSSQIVSNVVLSIISAN